MSTTESNITIPTYVYEGLVADSRLLHAMFSAGLVESSYFYSRALEILEEEDDA